MLGELPAMSWHCFSRLSNCIRLLERLREWQDSSSLIMLLVAVKRLLLVVVVSWRRLFAGQATSLSDSASISSAKQEKGDLAPDYRQHAIRSRITGCIYSRRLYFRTLIFLAIKSFLLVALLTDVDSNDRTRFGIGVEPSDGRTPGLWPVAFWSEVIGRLLLYGF